MKFKSLVQYVSTVSLSCFVSQIYAEDLRTMWPRGEYATSVAAGSRIIYAAGGGNGLFRSLDNGSTWVRRAISLPNNSTGSSFGIINGVVIDPLDESTVFAMSTCGRVGKSTDSGATFNVISTPHTVCSGSGANAGMALRGGEMLLAGSQGIWSSTNRGASFTRLNTQSSQAIAACPNGSLFVGTSSGVFTLNTANTLVATGLTGVNAYTLACDQSNRLVAGTGSNLQVSTNLGASWQAIPTTVMLNNSPNGVNSDVNSVGFKPNGEFISQVGRGWIVRAAPQTLSFTALEGLTGRFNGSSNETLCMLTNPNDSSQITVVFLEGNVAETTNGGRTFSNIASTGNTGSSRTAGCSGVQGTNLIFSAGGGRTVRSDDRGRSFTPTTGFGATESIGGIVLAGPRLVGWSTSGVYTSTDNGRSWGSRGGVLPSTFANRSNIAVSPSDNNFWLLAIGPTVYRTTDAGANWAVSGVTAPVDVWGITFAANGTILFATDGRGALISTDNGNSAAALNTGLETNARLYRFAVNPTDANLVYVTSFGGDEPAPNIAKIDLRNTAAGWQPYKIRAPLFSGSYSLVFSADGRVLHVLSNSQTVSYAQVDIIPNANADSDGDGMPDGIEDSAGLNPYAKDNDVFNDDGLFVRQVYRDLLGRTVDEAGLNFWVSELKAGRQTPSGMIEAFTTSGEYDSLTAPITRLYFGTYLRIPDYGGLQFWTDEYRSARRTLLQISTAFTTAPEFVQRYGSVDNRTFVSLLYSNVLGRPLDAVGADFWTNQLNTGALTRGAMLSQFTESGEYRQRRRAEIFTTLLFAGLLRREPDQTSFNESVNAINAGATLRSRIDIVRGSQEYRNRFLSS